MTRSIRRRSSSTGSSVHFRGKDLRVLPPARPRTSAAIQPATSPAQPGPRLDGMACRAEQSELNRAVRASTPYRPPVSRAAGRHDSAHRGQEPMVRIHLPPAVVLRTSVPLEGTTVSDACNAAIGPILALQSLGPPPFMHSAEFLDATSLAGHRKPAGFGDAANLAEGQPRPQCSEHPLVHAVRPDRRWQISSRGRNLRPPRHRACVRCATSMRSSARRWHR